MQYVHLLGSAMVLILIAYILVDLVHSKTDSKSSLIGRMITLALLFLILLRT